MIKSCITLLCIIYWFIPCLSQCQFDFPNYNVSFDLSPLAIQSGDYEIPHTALQEWTFYINLCTLAVTSSSACNSKLAFAFAEYNNNCYKSSSSNGGPPTASLITTQDPSFGIILQYTQGDWCSAGNKYRSISMHLMCDNTTTNIETTKNAYFEDQNSGQCTAKISPIHTAYACPIACHSNQNGELCSNHGECGYDHNIGTAKCFCFHGYTGTVCEQSIAVDLITDPYGPIDTSSKYIHGFYDNKVVYNLSWFSISATTFPKGRTGFIDLLDPGRFDYYWSAFDYPIDTSACPTSNADDSYFYQIDGGTGCFSFGAQYNVQLYDTYNPVKGLTISYTNGDPDWCPDWHEVNERKRSIEMTLICADFNFKENKNSIDLNTEIYEVDQCVYSATLFDIGVCPYQCITHSNNEISLCSSHGICSFDKVVGFVRCLCNHGYTGEFCQLTLSPTNDPTSNPTKTPSQNPTKTPTKIPTVIPKNPTISPSFNPSVSPTPSPTSNPTKTSTKTPTKIPTVTPTSMPTVTPTKIPTVTPTKTPTKIPTVTPTKTPTKNPTISPSFNPSVIPSSNPTSTPSLNPSVSPTPSPTSNPTIYGSPTITPTLIPSKNPTLLPTRTPSVMPTLVPTETQCDDIHGIEIQIEFYYDLLNVANSATTQIENILSELIETEIRAKNLTNNLESEHFNISVNEYDNNDEYYEMTVNAIIFVCGNQAQEILVISIENKLENDFLNVVNNKTVLFIQDDNIHIEVDVIRAIDKGVDTESTPMLTSSNEQDEFEAKNITTPLWMKLLFVVFGCLLTCCILSICIVIVKRCNKKTKNKQQQVSTQTTVNTNHEFANMGSMSYGTNTIFNGTNTIAMTNIVNTEGNIFGIEPGLPRRTKLMNSGSNIEGNNGSKFNALTTHGLNMSPSMHNIDVVEDEHIMTPNGNEVNSNIQNDEFIVTGDDDNDGYNFVEQNVTKGGYWNEDKNENVVSSDDEMITLNGIDDVNLNNNEFVVNDNDVVDAVDMMTIQ